jgi:uncharacterized glyoxalase superfamily protein PhnB
LSDQRGFTSICYIFVSAVMHGGLTDQGGALGFGSKCGEITIRMDEKTGQALPASKPESVEKTYLELKNSGVEFSEELTTTSWGKYAILKDPDGNEFEIS